MENTNKTAEQSPISSETKQNSPVHTPQTGTTNEPTPPVDNSSVLNITPDDLSKRVHRFLLLGNNLQEIKKDALSQGIPEKTWNDAIAILFPPKKMPIGKIILLIVVAFFVLLFSLLGYLYFRFSTTETAKKSSAPISSFFHGFTKSPLTFSRLILSKKLDEEIAKSEKKEEVSKEVEIKVLDVPPSTTEPQPLPENINEATTSPTTNPATNIAPAIKRPKPAPKPAENVEVVSPEEKEVDSRNPLGVKRRKF